MDAADIFVTIKGTAKTSVVSAPSGHASKLVELVDVNAIPLANGDVLTYISANGKFEFHPGAGSTSNAFGTINIAGQNNVIAHSSSDTVKFIAGTGILLTTDNVNSSVTVVATGGSAVDQFARDKANAADVTAHAAFNEANIAFTLATTANTVAASSYTQANIATTNADAAFAVSNTANTTAHAAFNEANIAFTLATTANTVAASSYTQANIATTNADAAFAKANGAIYTAAQIRANISNTAPINYSQSTGIISHELSGATASGYGDAATVPKIVVNSSGHITSVVNTAIQISGNAIVSGFVSANHVFDLRVSLNATSVAVGTWTSQNCSETSDWFAVAWSPELGIFAAIASAGTNQVMTSPDGITWTSRSAAAGNFWYALTWAPQIGTFCAVALGGEVMTSRDGIIWTLRTQSQSSQWVDVEWSPQLGLFVVVSAGAMMTSPDGINWTNRTPAEPNQWRSSVWSPELGIFVSVSADGTNRVQTSPDGITWTARAASEASSWFSVEWGDELGLFVAVASAGTNQVMTSPDGITWTSRSSPVSDWNDISWSPELKVFAAIGFSGSNPKIMHSVNGITWTTRQQPEVAGWRRIAWSPELGIFVAVASSATNRVMSSTEVGLYRTIKNARNLANTANSTGQAAFDKANSAIYTAAQIRANISNTAPINYNSTTGVISLPSTANGQTLIGNTVSGAFDVATLTQGTGILITNDKGSITIASSGAGAAVDQFSRDHGNGAFDKANSAIYTAAQIRANISNTTPILYDPTTGVVSLTTVPVTLGGTGQTSYSNGDLLIGNTMSGGLDRANLTQGSGIQITNENGKVTIRATAGKVYYFEYSGQSDVVPYHKLLSAPSTHAENTVVKSFTTISSFVLMTSFITEPGEPNVTLLPSGTYGRHIHATTGGNGHVAQLRIELYKYAANGLETLLRTADSPQFDAGNAVDLLSWNVTDPVGHDLVVTDRLLMKMYGTRITGGGGTVTITVYTEGNSRASYATTSIQGIAGAGVTSVAGRVGAVLLNTNDVTENAAGPYYFTAAKVRANISNTAPINYNSTTGVISLPSTANGQTLIGNTVSGAFDVATLTQGTGISITNDKGSITIAATGGASGNGFGIIAVAGQSNVVAHMANDVFNLVQGTGIVITTDITTNAVTIAATGGSAIDQFARDHGNGAFDKANSAIFTAAQIRANISNAYPVYYDATTGVVSFVPATANGQTLIGNTVSGTFDVNTIAQTAPVIVVNGKGTVTLSHASSGVVATVYGNASIVPSVTVDAFGHITGAVNTTIAIDAAAIATGILSVVRGGTGQSAYTNGQILIGNTGSTGLDKATIAQSAPIIITNLQGSITVSHARSGVVALDSYGSQSIIPVMAVDANGHLTAVVNTAIGGLGTGVLTTGILPVSRGGTGLDATGIVNGSIHVGNTVNVGFDTTTIAQTAPVIVVNGKGTITLSHASSGVTAKTYGSASLVPAIAVDAFGHVTSVVNTGIVIDASAIGSGVLLVAQGGTGQSVYANGQLLIGNTGSGGLDKATIAQSAPIIITNLQGSITVSHARSGVTALDSYGSGAIIPVIAVDANGHLTAVVNTAIAGLSTGVLTTGILPVARGGTGKDATGLANGQLLIGNTVNTGFDLTTIAQTAPVIVVNGKGTITLSHASSGVTAAVYGNGSIIPSITVDAFGHITGAVNTTVAISAAQVTSGTLAVAQGGTGQSAYTNGQILIGNTGSTGLDKATIAQSAPIIITNLQGSITVSHARSGVTAVDSYGSGSIIPVFAVDANGHLTAVVNTAIAGLSTGVLTTGILSVARGGTGKDATGLVNGQILIANTVNTGFDLAAVTQTAPVIVSTDKGSIRLSHARSGVTAATYGSASLIPVITVDDNGHVTTITTSAASGLPAATANGQLLVGNTVSSSFDVYTPAQSAPVIVTVGKGTITYSHARSGVVASTYGSASLIPVITIDDNGHITTATTAAASGLPPATANGQTLIGNTVSGSFDVSLIAQTAPVIVVNGKGTVTLSHASSGVAASTYGNFHQLPSITIDAFGHITAAALQTITLNIALGGALAEVNGATANGQVPIGNTVSGAFDVVPIAQTAPVIVTNGKGTITLSHASSGVVASTYGSGTLVPVITVDALGHLTTVTTVAITGGTGAISKQSTTGLAFGNAAVDAAAFVITDAAVGASSIITGQIAYVAPTGKDLDEVEMDSFELKFAPGVGQFTVYVKSLEGYVTGNFTLNYTIY